jgi:hypothetical protein
VHFVFVLAPLAVKALFFIVHITGSIASFSLNIGMSTYRTAFLLGWLAEKAEKLVHLRTVKVEARDIARHHHII